MQRALSGLDTTAALLVPCPFPFLNSNFFDSMRNYTRIGTWGLLAIVALRMGIGWHFFMEGSQKVKTGSFSSEGFLKSSEGRFAGLFRGLIWDNDGKIRLETRVSADKKTELAIKQEFVDAAKQAETHFLLTKEQIGKLERVKSQHLDNLDQLYAENQEAIEKYAKGAERIDRMNQSAVWGDIAGLRSQKQSIAQERLAAVKPVLDSIDALWKNYEQKLNGVATREQQLQAGRFYFHRPGESFFSARTLDKLIPVFDLTVGVLLILGLFVPLASSLGAAFLFGVVLSQFPGDPNTQMTYFHSIEALALLALAAIGAGRFAGLDFFVWAWKQNRLAAQLSRKPATATA